MIPKNLESLSETELQKLLDEGREEDRCIEYKRGPLGATNQDRISGLLKPICSFTNTDGGDLVIGIDAPSGAPKALTGFTIENPDEFRLMLEHVIYNGIEPQVRGIQIKLVTLTDGKYAVVVRTPKSWVGPHRLKTNSKFYARNTAGSYELDIPQIRQAFYLTESLAHGIRDIRAERIALNCGGGSPVRLAEGARVIFDVIPIASIGSKNLLPVRELQRAASTLHPTRGGSIDYFLNFDGLVVTSGLPDAAGFRSYVQAFRNGIIEFVHTYRPADNKRIIPSLGLEETLIRNLKSAVTVYREIDMPSPAFLCVSLANVRGFWLGVDRIDAFFNDELRSFDRDVISIPEIELEALDIDAATTLKPIFDRIWNAAGLPESIHSKPHLR